MGSGQSTLANFDAPGSTSKLTMAEEMLMHRTGQSCRLGDYELLHCTDAALLCYFGTATPKWNGLHKCRTYQCVAGFSETVSINKS